MPLVKSTALAVVFSSLMIAGAHAQALAPTPAQTPATNGATTIPGVTTTAPTQVVPERISPADRAGNPGDTTGGTPFSAGPAPTDGSQISPAMKDTQPSGAPAVPNLSR